MPALEFLQPNATSFADSGAGGDFFSTASADGERDAIAAGHRFVRIEGYVAKTKR